MYSSYNHKFTGIVIITVLHNSNSNNNSYWINLTTTLYYSIIGSLRLQTMSSNLLDSESVTDISDVSVDSREKW